MEGYDLITAVDDKRWGTVVGKEGDYVIVEHGTLWKHRFAVPQDAVEVDDEAKEARTSLSGELISESPKVDSELDHEAVARHYGIAETSETAGGETATEERAQIREGGADMAGLPDESPALLGDRLSDVREDDKP